MLGATIGRRVLLAALVASVHVARVLAWAGDSGAGNNCTVQAPLGAGLDDTDQVRVSNLVERGQCLTDASHSLQIEAAIARCGHYGTTTINEGVYNITR